MITGEELQMVTNKTNTPRTKIQRAVVRRINLILVAACSLTFANLSHAEDLNDQRQAARQEVAPLFFNKFISVDAELVSSSGPEFFQRLLEHVLLGAQRSLQISQIRSSLSSPHLVREHGPEVSME